MRISLCLITKNELEGCKLDVPKLPKDAFDEVYAVDGASTDGTVEYLEAQGIPVYQQPKKGLNAAYIHANNLSNCDAVVTFFPKGTIPTDDLLKFRPLFDRGYQLIIASRQIKGSSNDEDSSLWRPRKWAVRYLAILAAMIWRSEGYWVRDVLHGFKGWTCDSFSNMNILDHGLSIDIEMVVRAYKLNFTRTEFPTTEIPRKYNDTHFRFWPTGKKLLVYLWYEIRRED